ncbi:hypothetical protein P43SY_007262 [Pythium insidiosum]|uniref:Uncharacterized protein n=1 Tax=Pythium insidiosum TaxID=114742 RepID=A0AAD5QAV9_PYTIN|nr:hypothetical protein P43SY_007262 [Pythium insidiosum]
MAGGITLAISRLFRSLRLKHDAANDTDDNTQLHHCGVTGDASTTHSPGAGSTKVQFPTSLARQVRHVVDYTQQLNKLARTSNGSSGSIARRRAAVLKTMHRIVTILEEREDNEKSSRHSRAIPLNIAVEQLLMAWESALICIDLSMHSSSSIATAATDRVSSDSSSSSSSNGSSSDEHGSQLEAAATTLIKLIVHQKEIDMALLALDVETLERVFCCLLRSEHFQILKGTQLFLLKHFPVFSMTIREMLVKLFASQFKRLFLHWHRDVRFCYYHVLLYLTYPGNRIVLGAKSDELILGSEAAQIFDIHGLVRSAASKKWEDFDVPLCELLTAYNRVARPQRAKAPASFGRSSMSIRPKPSSRNSTRPSVSMRHSISVPPAPMSAPANYSTAPVRELPKLAPWVEELKFPTIQRSVQEYRRHVQTYFQCAQQISIHDRVPTPEFHQQGRHNRRRPSTAQIDFRSVRRGGQALAFCNCMSKDFLHSPQSTYTSIPQQQPVDVVVVPVAIPLDGPATPKVEYKRLRDPRADSDAVGMLRDRYLYFKMQNYNRRSNPRRPEVFLDESYCKGERYCIVGAGVIRVKNGKMHGDNKSNGGGSGVGHRSSSYTSLPQQTPVDVVVVPVAVPIEPPSSPKTDYERV